MGFWSTFARCGTVFLIAGSALLSLSCKKEKARGNVNPETLITMQSEDLSMTVSKNGLKSYHFTTPLMQQYGLAAEPYTKYPDGVFVQTFQDSTEVVESTLRADEAINYEKRDLWMASGHVVASGSGNTLYTEQLFWDAKTDRVYSNVRVKVVDKDGEHYGEGFESDKDLKSWMFRDYEGTIAVETAPNEEYDGAAGGPSDASAGEQTVPSGGRSVGNGYAPSRRQVLSPGWNPTQGGGTLRPVPALKEGDPGTENVFRPESGEEDERAEYMGSVIVIAVVSLLLSAFFSGMEIAFTSSNKLKLEIDRKQDGLFGRIADVFINNPGQYITTMLVGNNIVLVLYSLNMTVIIHALADMWGLRLGTGTWSVLLESLISTVIIIFVGEFTPKAIVKLRPNAYLRAFSVPLYFFYIVLYPIAKFATWLSFGLLRLFGIRVKDSDGIKSFEKVDLENLLEENTETQSEQENEIRIFQNALDFSDILVRDCMVPRVDVEAVDVESSIGEIYGRFIESQYSRIFVWDGSIDNIVGYVNIKSLFRNPASIRDIMIGVRYVPETMPAERLLEEFTKNRISVAVVIDEFGGTAGIISLEDVLEEIFGEIDDEHDTSDMVERQVAENEYVFSSRLEVKYLNEKYGLGIEESDEYETLAGYIISNENGIPPTGAEVSIGNKLIRILKSSSSRIELVKVRLL